MYYSQEDEKTRRKRNVFYKNTTKYFDIYKQFALRTTQTFFRLYRYVTRTNVSFFDPSPNDQRTEHSCA